MDTIVTSIRLYITIFSLVFSAQYSPSASVSANNYYFIIEERANERKRDVK